MPPTDASTDAGTACAPNGTPTAAHSSTAARTGTTGPTGGTADTDTTDQPVTGTAVTAVRSDSEDTLDLRLPDEFLDFLAEEAEKHGGGPGEGDGAEAWPTDGVPTDDDLLDRLADWGPVTTPVGVLHLLPVRVERDLPLISRWMNDPAVAAFWKLAGPQSVTEGHLRHQLAGDGRSIPCLGLLDGTPMSYWEVYRADLDPLARHYPARPHDTGVHLVIGGVADRGRGIGSALLRAFADLVLDKRPSCARVIAEPDLRNTPSIAAFLSAGFRFSAEVDLPDKRAALMVRDRALRDLL
ncbi:GNAT family N-acetyltransferase [Streptomyces acidicola]|uniref:Lysine N-acyltransferase MbtK n=1 Tax=Streptomyces acidicola TaxID=2596892 RepID=A0A5N8X7U2_9ACTN|nr:acetyltransferase [Streptomyces acidicola]